MPRSRGMWLALLACAAGMAHADVEASLDLRLVHSDGRKGFLDGGLGKLRYDGSEDGPQLGRMRLAWRGPIAGNWHASADVSAWSLDDHNALDLTEAWLEWRPVPTSAWRSNLKVGAFYPPISLEHRAPGWSNPYTISSSALNTWVGEELRTIGVAYELEHLGTATGGRFDYGVHAAVFGWNDPAGIVVAMRGWALHDRQTPLFGRIGVYAPDSHSQRVMFSEIDHRAGYHAGAYVKSDNGVELRALHYDNRGDPGAYKASIDDYAWDTRFDSAGLRYDGPGGATLMAQWLEGDTTINPGPLRSWHFDTHFLLLAQSIGAHRLAARYDRFAMHQARPISPTGRRDSGHAFTVGWTWTLDRHVELAAEWLRADSYNTRRSSIREPRNAVEHSLQLALRLQL